MLDTIQVRVEYSEEDDEHGPVYVASNDDLMFTTDGRTFEEMVRNVREAIAACLDDEDLIADLGLVLNPRIVFSMAIEYAETA
jgi:predicted RNase H-like HicB family nuclease